jgi:hypothetical protein
LVFYRVHSLEKPFEMDVTLENPLNEKKGIGKHFSNGFKRLF